MFADVVRNQMISSIKYIKPVLFHASTGLTADVYRQMQTDFLPAPLVALHSPVPDVMAGVWSTLRETLMAGVVDRTLKEVVAAAVSQANACPFCIDAHTAMLHATDEHTLAGALLSRAYDRIEAPHLRGLVRWAIEGPTAQSNGAELPSLRPDEAAEVIGTAVVFHYLNRMANVFLGDALIPLPAPLQQVTRRVFAATAGKRIVRRLPSGASLQFVAPAPLPDDLAWAEPAPVVAQSLAGLVAAVEVAGAAAIAEPVRVLVDEQVRTWQGEQMGIGRGWVDDLVVALAPEHRVAARLALVTALASFQVDERLVIDYRLQHSHDADLLATTAWASLRAARRAGVWLAAPFTTMEKAV